MNNYLSPQTSDHKKSPKHMELEIQVLHIAWGMHSKWYISTG
jgi:hypothetical protein